MCIRDRLFVDGYYDENNGLNTAALEKGADIQKRENPYNFFDKSNFFIDNIYISSVNDRLINIC